MPARVYRAPVPLSRTRTAWFKESATTTDVAESAAKDKGVFSAMDAGGPLPRAKPEEPGRPASVSTAQLAKPELVGVAVGVGVLEKEAPGEGDLEGVDTAVTVGVGVALLSGHATCRMR